MRSQKGGFKVRPFAAARALRLVGTVLSTTLVLAAAGGHATPANPAPQPAVETIIFGIVGKTATLWPYYVADKQGFLAAHGVKVDLIATGASANVSQQLTAGSLNLGESGLPDFIRAINAGAPIKIIGGGVATPPYSVLADPSIKTWDQLKGKTVIIGGPHDITRIYFDTMAEAHGLKDSDFTFAYAGATNNRYAALNSRSVAAAILFPPFDFHAEAQGFTNLGSVQRYLRNFPFTGYSANIVWAARHAATVVSYLKAYLQAVHWLYNPVNKAAAVAILSEATNTDRADGEKTYDLFFRQIGAYRKDGTISTPGFNLLLAALVKTGDLGTPVPPASKFVDDSYIRRANAAK